MKRPTLIALALVWGCGSPAEPPRPETRSVDVDTLATFDGGPITAADLDQAMLALPPAERIQMGTDDLGPYASLVRRLAFERVALAEARSLGLDQDPEVVSEVDGLRRQALGLHHLDQVLPPLEVPTEAEIEAVFAERRDQLDQPEARSTYHIFVRTSDNRPAEDVQASLEDVRQRVLDGESFSLLAAEISDSESRHQEGFIGRIVPGQLPAAFETVLFGLAEKVPSEPITTADGVHLFYVETIIPARSATVDELRSRIRRELLTQRRQAAVEATLDALPLPAGSFVPEPDELAALLRAGDPSAVVVRLGDFELRLGPFSRLVVRERDQLPPSQRLTEAERVPHRVLDAVVKRERAYLAAEAAGVSLPAESVAALDARREALLLERYQRQMLARALDDLPERLAAFHRDNHRRFTSPLRLHLRRLTMAVGPAATKVMGALESQRQAIEAGQTDLDAVAQAVGGTVEDLGVLTLDQLKLADPKAALFASRMARGGASPPYTSDRNTIAMFTVEDRHEPEPLPYEAVHAAVRTSFLQRHGREIHDSVVDAKLEAAGFVVYDDHLAKAVAALSGS